MIRAVAMVVLCLILGNDCFLWMGEKHPRALMLMYWLLLPLAAIGAVAGLVLSAVLIGSRPFGMMKPSFLEVFLTVAIFAAALLFLVLLGLVLRLIAKLLWHPSAEMQKEIEAIKAENAAAEAKRKRKREMKDWICPDCGTENDATRVRCSLCDRLYTENQTDT